MTSSGRVHLVFGGGGGLGEHVVTALGAGTVRVVVGDVDLAAAERVAAAAAGSRHRRQRGGCRHQRHGERRGGDQLRRRDRRRPLQRRQRGRRRWSLSHRGLVGRASGRAARRQLRRDRPGDPRGRPRVAPPWRWGRRQCRLGGSACGRTLAARDTAPARVPSSRSRVPSPPSWQARTSACGPSARRRSRPGCTSG